VSGFLRFVGIVNAAIWFGAGVFFAAAILPGAFSQDMHKVFGVPAESPYYSYYPGGVALVLFKRFFVLQYICGIIALLHLFAEKLYLGRALPKFGTALVIGIFGLALIGGVWLQPRLENYRQTMYVNASTEEKERARHSFGLWHGISQFANLVVIGGLLAHLARVSRPGESDRYTTFTIFRG
jgi:hypothetical protein